MLIVGDGRALTFIDYEVGQRQRWPINDSPAVGAAQSEPGSRPLRPRRPGRRAAADDRGARSAPARVRHDHHRASPSRPGAPGGLILQGWNTRDAQNNLTTVRLSGQRFNVPVADSAFGYRSPTRRGPAPLKLQGTFRSSGRQVDSPKRKTAIAVSGFGFSPCCPDRDSRLTSRNNAWWPSLHAPGAGAFHFGPSAAKSAPCPRL